MVGSAAISGEREDQARRELERQRVSAGLNVYDDALTSYDADVARYQ